MVSPGDDALVVAGWFARFVSILFAERRSILLRLPMVGVQWGVDTLALAGDVASLPVLVAVEVCRGLLERVLVDTVAQAWGVPEVPILPASFEIAGLR